MSETVVEVLRLIAALPGVRAAVTLSPAVLPAILAAEDRYESTAALPIVNVGVRQALARDTVVAILKDASFRRPPTSTLYLVEEGSAPAGEELRIADRVYHVIGEEIVADGQEPAPGAVPLSDAFFIYPDRRTQAARPSRFLLPPVPFPELSLPPWSRRLCKVVSASPSSLGDACVREGCGFPDDPALATLIVGFCEAGVRA